MEQSNPAAPAATLDDIRQQRADDAFRAALAQPDPVISQLSQVACQYLQLAGVMGEQLNRSLAVADNPADQAEQLAPAIDRAVRLGRNAAYLLRLQERLG